MSSYYKQDGIECIDIIEAYDLGFCLGNVVKYVLRAGRKTEDELEDIQKALWYLMRYRESLAQD